jgi:hypothetical protein
MRSENPASAAKATRRAAGAEKTGVTTVSLHSSEARLGHDHFVIKPIYEKEEGAACVISGHLVR